MRPKLTVGGPPSPLTPTYWLSDVQGSTDMKPAVVPPAPAVPPAPPIPAVPVAPPAAPPALEPPAPGSPGPLPLLSVQPAAGSPSTRTTRGKQRIASRKLRFTSLTISAR